MMASIYKILVRYTQRVVSPQRGRMNILSRARVRIGF